MDLVKQENKIAVLDRKIPLRAIPEEKLNKVLLMDFLPWLSGLLSLTDETAVERLEIALPAIKDQCVGMGFSEIKKMFEMYADNRLNISPVANYFDRILLGKIVEEYRLQKPKKMIEEKKPDLTEKEKEQILIDGVERLEKEYSETGDIKGVVGHIYDYLYPLGKLPEHTKGFKAIIKEKAKKIAKSEQMTECMRNIELRRKIKKVIERIDNDDFDGLAEISKRLVLIEYFKTK